MGTPSIMDMAEELFNHAWSWKKYPPNFWDDDMEEERVWYKSLVEYLLKHYKVEPR